MRKLSLVLVLLMSTSYTFAKSKKSLTTTNSSKFDVRVPIKNWLKTKNDGFRFGISKGSLEINARARQNGLDNSSNESNSTKIQLTFGYEEIKTQLFGYSVFGTYQDVDMDKAIHTGDLRNMRVSGNATFGMTTQAYVYGGLNYGKWYGSELAESNIDAGIGYQAGLGLKLHKKAHLEIEYLTLLNEGRQNGINLDLEAKGLMLTVKTPFTFSI